MEAIILQILNGLDKGSAYALIALGLTLIFGTLGVVNFAHGALFMIGAFCAVTLSRILTLSRTTVDETQKDFLGNPLKVDVPYVHDWFGQATGDVIIDWAVPLSILFAIPVMIAIGVIMERGLIKHFYKRPHADQITRSSTPTGVWSILPLPRSSSVLSLPSCSSPPSGWLCAPAWPTARPWACWASTSTSALPSCSVWPQRSRVWRV